MIKILAVDDEPGICAIVKNAFSPMGFTVLSAYGGEEALAVMQREQPKLVFLDIRMPGMSGLEVLRRIKEGHPGVRVIMLTVLSDEATRQEAKRLGADDFISKPFISEHLEEVMRQEIAMLLGGGSGEREGDSRH